MVEGEKSCRERRDERGWLWWLPKVQPEAIVFGVYVGGKTGMDLSQVGVHVPTLELFHAVIRMAAGSEWHVKGVHHLRYSEHKTIVVGLIYKLS